MPTHDNFKRDIRRKLQPCLRKHPKPDKENGTDDLHTDIMIQRTERAHVILVGVDHLILVGVWAMLYST